MPRAGPIGSSPRLTRSAGRWYALAQAIGSREWRGSACRPQEPESQAGVASLAVLAAPVRWQRLRRPARTRSRRRATRRTTSRALLVDAGRRRVRARRWSSRCCCSSWKRRHRRGIGARHRGRQPGERAAWYVVVGAGIVLPILLDRGPLRDLRHLRDPHDRRRRPPRDTAHRSRSSATSGGGRCATRARRRRPRTRSTSRCGTPVRRRGAHGRRHPQLLGAAAEPQDRRDPGADQRDRAVRRRRRALPRRSAPSSAACSTRTWACTCSPTRRPPSAAGSRASRRPPGARRRPRRGRASRSSRGGACASCHAIRGTDRERRRRARPHPPREPHDDRRR